MLSMKMVFTILTGTGLIISALLFAILETSPRRLTSAFTNINPGRELLVTRSSTPSTQLQQLQGKNVPPAQLQSKEPGTTREQEVVLILAYGRSGTTLLGNIFNQSPRVFYLFEPLHGLRRIYGYNNPDYNSLAMYTLIELFQCSFKDRLLANEMANFYRYYSNALSSPPFCRYHFKDPKWNATNCIPVNNVLLENVCKRKYDTLVFKILMDRIPWVSIDQLFKACALAETKCKIIHLIRDFRPVTFSSRKVAFYREVDAVTKPSMRKFAYEICHFTEQNLALVRKFSSSWSERYRLLRYEDMVLEPVKFLHDLYEFAGLEVTKDIEEWLNKTTQPSELALKAEERKPVSSVRNSLEILNKWRHTSHPCDVNVVERYCLPVMNLMGYVPTGGSVELLKNLDVQLFKSSYIANEWARK